MREGFVFEESKKRKRTRNQKKGRRKRSNSGGKGGKECAILKRRYNDGKLMSLSWKYGREKFVF